MAIMSVERRDEALHDLAEAVRSMDLPHGTRIHGASVEPYVDADGERALKAVIILDPPEEGGWSAELTHELRARINRLAAEHHLDEYVYTALFTQEEFEARGRVDEDSEDSTTSAIDEALTQDQDGS
jgi:hypothetical protein